MTSSAASARIRRVLGATIAVVLLCSHDASMQQSSAANSVITEALIRGHMESLASDAMRGRGSGTEDERRAAMYIGAQMRKWGVEPLGDSGDFVKEIETGRQVPAAPSVLTIGDLHLTHGKEMLVQTLGANNVSGPLVMFKPGTPATAGSVVLVPVGVTPAPAELNGTAAVLTAETPPLRANWDLVGSGISGTGSCGGRGRQTRLVLSSDAFKAAAKLADSGATASVQTERKSGHTWDAIGRLKGSDPTQATDVILLTAHLDHIGVGGPGPDMICNGADDDASGSIAVLGLAEALAKGPRPKRTVIFAWFGSEETDGAGASDFLAHPPVPLTQIVANLEFEMIANRDALVPPHTLWLTGYDCSTLGPDLAKQGARIIGDPHPTDGFFGRSDNVQLARKGIIAQTISSFDSVSSKTYHQASDEISTVDFAHMADSIKSMVSPVLWLANSTYKPTWLEGKDPSKVGGSCGARPGRGGGE